MWGRLGHLFVIVAASFTTGSAVAMSNSGVAPLGRCEVVGEDKLGPRSAGSQVICGEVERAIEAQAPTVLYSAKIKVLSPSRLAATLIVNGRALPVQNFAVMDGKLSDTSIKRFASALARAVVEASKS
jgi:hypothetical protein